MSAFVINPYVFGGGVDLTTDLLHYWDLDATASTMSDLHGALDLTRGGTVNTSSTGAPDGGSCVEMNTAGGVVGYFSANSVAKISSYDTAVTINIWAYSTGLSGTGNWFINHRNQNFADTIFFQIRETASGETGSFANTTSFFSVTTASATSLNTWKMLTLRKDGNSIEFFRDGASVGTATFSGSFGTANAPFAIGTSSWALGNNGLSHRGRLFAAGIWDAALNQDQINALYNGGSGLRYADL